MVAAMVAYAPVAIENFADIAECDYRKSTSLAQEKYGNISSLLRKINADYGGVNLFLMRICGVDAAVLEQAAGNFLGGGEREGSGK